MRKWTKYLAGAGAAALFAVSAASPAQAQYYGRYYDHDDGIDIGDIAAGVAIIGGAALAIDALTDNDRYDRYRGYYGRPYAYGYGYERASLNACASVAQRYGRLERITDVDTRRNGTVRVRGRLLVRDGWRDFDRDDFTCYAQAGRVYDFRV